MIAPGDKQPSAQPQTQQRPVTPVVSLNEIRPTTLGGFIGQSQLKSIVHIAVTASRKSNEPVSHALLSGPPGLGKTTMAQIIAKERGVGFLTVAADALTDSMSVRRMLADVSYDGYDAKGQVTGNILPTVVFLDEAHRLPRQGQELLYSALEDRVVEVIAKNPLTGRTEAKREWVPKFTLIAATSRPADLTTAFRDRLRLHLQFEPYPFEDSYNIARGTLAKLRLRAGETAWGAIARRGRGVPRKIVAICEMVRDVVIMRNGCYITESVLGEAFTALNIDPIGLTRQEVRVLGHLAQSGKPVGIRTIADLLGEDERAVETSVEPYLISSGLITRTAKGRVLTEVGLQHLRVCHGFGM